MAVPAAYRSSDEKADDRWTLAFYDPYKYFERSVSFSDQILKKKSDCCIHAITSGMMGYVDSSSILPRLVYQSRENPCVALWRSKGLKMRPEEWYQMAKKVDLNDWIDPKYIVSNGTTPVPPFWWAYVPAGLKSFENAFSSRDMIKNAITIASLLDVQRVPDTACRMWSKLLSLPMEATHEKLLFTLKDKSNYHIRRYTNGTWTVSTSKITMPWKHGYVYLVVLGRLANQHHD